MNWPNWGLDRLKKFKFDSSKLMIQKVKKFIKKIIFTSPRFKIGVNSTILRPYWVHNPRYVLVGSRVTIGRNLVINPIRTYCDKKHDGSVVIGNDVYIGGNCQIHAMNALYIGDGVVLSEYVYISDTLHGTNPMSGLIMKQPLINKGLVRIGEGVFVGYGASILPGVELGDHCVVAARSVVTQSFPAYTMVAGVPARKIKYFDLSSQQWVKVSEEAQ